jgi:hypothetical protein
MGNNKPREVTPEEHRAILGLAMLELHDLLLQSAKLGWSPMTWEDAAVFVALAIHPTVREGLRKPRYKGTINYVPEEVDPDDK